MRHILFCKKSFHSVSIDEIAQKANVTKGAFYHHFASKNVIFESCFVLQVQRIENLLMKVKVSSDPFVEAVNKAKSFLTFVRDERRSLIPLDEVITVLGWRRWKEIDISLRRNSSGIRF
ncbi:MAG: helix-turn-helix transcriptional regulator [Xanthomonadaceae bacterium]|nr:helix-turn-helix transcriptional regulator [Xanthomonadaceae bacterium]